MRRPNQKYIALAYIHTKKYKYLYLGIFLWVTSRTRKIERKQHHMSVIFNKRSPRRSQELLLMLYKHRCYKWLRRFKWRAYMNSCPRYFSSLVIHLIYFIPTCRIDTVITPRSNILTHVQIHLYIMYIRMITDNLKFCNVTQYDHPSYKERGMTCSGKYIY